MINVKDLLEERKLITKNLSYYIYQVNEYKSRLTYIDNTLKKKVENEGCFIC